MRPVIKAIIIGFIFVPVLPFGLAARLAHRLLGSALLFDTFAQAVSLVPGKLGSYTRACYYKQTLRKTYLDIDLAFGTIVTKIESSIGHRVYIGLYCSVGYCDIGDDVVIANNISILSGSAQHNFENPDRPIFDDSDSFTMMRIGHDTFVGDQSVIMADVGHHTIIGAGTIVTKPLPDYVVAVGNPARVLKSRREQSETD